MTKPDWEWDNSVDCRHKKCKGCGKSMYLALDGAIKYKNDPWHLHCLLDMLTIYHQDNSVALTNELLKEWGNAP